MSELLPGSKIRAKTPVLAKYFLAVVLKKQHFACSREEWRSVLPKVNFTLSMGEAAFLKQ